MLRQTNQTRENVAFNILEGSDGFLFVPFSVFTLREVATIAGRVKKEHEAKRKKAAMILIIADMHQAWNDLVIAKHCEDDESGYWEQLKHCSQLLAKVSKDHRELYLEEIVRHLENCEPISPALYLGASKQLRKRAQKRALKKHHEAEA